MLWIGLHLPRLALEAFAAALPPERAQAPLALVEAQRIVVADARAQALGVQPGLTRRSAFVLAPQLVLGEPDAAREALALRAVAHAALSYTPAVALAGAQDVVLEVASSLRCFGGLERLVQRLRATLTPLGHALQLASAPTAQGAVLLARASDGLHCAGSQALERALDALPIALLDAGGAPAETLRGMGLQRLGELKALPRAGLARRAGAALLDEIDRARGRRPDPRAWVVPLPVFEERLELAWRADTAEQVLHGAGLLLQRLVAWAAARQARVRSLRLELRHEARHRIEAATPAASTLELALAAPSADAVLLRGLLRERLGRTRLAAPTFELLLHCAELCMEGAPNGELFPAPRSEREGLAQLLDRLQARLGPQRLQRLQRVADHRPERASRRRPAGAAGAARQAPAAPLEPGSQPVWLLAEPQALAERDALPLLEGRPLQLLSGPERIEAGWWDGVLAERDYFVAQAVDGALVWVYRSRRPRPGGAPGWFLQGRFA